MLADILHEIVDLVHGAETPNPGTLADLHEAIDRELPKDKKTPPAADRRPTA